MNATQPGNVGAFPKPDGINCPHILGVRSPIHNVMLNSRLTTLMPSLMIILIDQSPIPYLCIPLILYITHLWITENDAQHTFKAP